MAKAEPVTNPASSSSGSPKNASAGRIKSISGGGPAFSAKSDPTKGFPCPNNPYGK